MYKTNNRAGGLFGTEEAQIAKSETGETIEQKIDRIVNNKEPITDGAPIIYTERKDGVMPEYNPRADRWDIAIDAMGTGTQARIAERKARLDELNKKGDGETPEGTETSEPASK